MSVLVLVAKALGQERTETPLQFPAFVSSVGGVHAAFLCPPEGSSSIATCPPEAQWGGLGGLSPSPLQFPTPSTEH